MAKQLNVNLAFTADTSKAKAQIQDLQNQLTKVINQPTTGLGSDMANKINQASRAAAELKVHLEQAMNPKTGTLDFSKLNQSLQKSGISLNTYAAKLKEIGPEGQKAFSMLAQSVASAEVPIRRSNALLSELWVTMKNTARWQLTSSVLHGFIGALQSAYGYAQDLNESLNDIRIVTGNSVDQMADFAKEANKAAKALSTSTVNYTNAALIYYQQGLNEQQVKERTDITVKMANVSKQSAEIVSDQLTAVWNNFYDGSQSLEHFADVMTRLGADTASSSDEIAQGLEKFAAIGDTIGLSFDNAAAALATVTATTRQSADVVGTAFKTIFARIQGLNLGETLDDGTNLNKYSKALDKVGISIFEQNGELKDMDNILAEMGAKWETLSRDQQVALAQTVAGVRQYNQLIALMDNYDFYEKNLFSAKNAEGSLNEQADIYEESWQAASNRVKASLEEIYDALLNDEAFINLLNNIAKIINGFDTIIDSVGGLKGLLTSVAVIIGKLKFDSIVSGIQGTVYNIRNTFDSGKAMRQQKVDTLQNMITTPEDPDAGLSIIESTNNEVITAQLKSQQFLIDNVKKLSTEEQRVLQILMDQQAARSKQAISAAEAAQSAETRFDDASVIMTGYVGVNVTDRKSIYTKAKALGELESNGDNSREAKIQAQQLQKQIDDEIDLISKKNHLSKKETEYLREYSEAAKEKVKTKATLNKTTAEATREINKESIAQEKETQKKKEAEQAARKLKAAKDAGIDSSEKSQKKLSISAAGFVQGGMAALSMASAISMLGSAFDTWKDPDLSWGEKISSISMSLMFTIPMLCNGLKEWNKLLQVSTTLANLRAMAEEEVLGVIIKEKGAIGLLRMAKMLENKEDKESVANVIAKVLVKKGLIKEEEKEAFVTALLTKLKNADNAADVKDILFDTIKTFNKKKLNAELIKQLALKAKELLFAAKWLIVAAAIAAAIWAIVYAYKAEERALKSAQEGARNAAEAYQDLKQKYDDLKASIEEYNNAKKAFEELEKGAEGYQEALEKANEAARKLIETNNLFDDWHYDKNGLIVIDEKALAEAESAAQNRVNSASMNVAAANIKLNETKKDVATPSWLEEDVTSEKLLGSINSEVFTSIKDAIDSGVPYTGLKAEDLGLTTLELNHLIFAIGQLGDKAESTYQELTSLNQSNEYYAEQLALGSVQTNGIGSNIEDKDQRDAYQKVYANLLAQDDDYIKQIEENADNAKKASDTDLTGVMKRIRKSNDDLMDVGWQLNDEELMRLYMRDVKGWSDQDAKAAIYDSNKSGTGQMKLGDEIVEFNDQQMRNELLTKYLADEMAANLSGSDYNQDEIKAILDSVTALPDTNKGEVSSGETELLNALMNYKEGETVSVNWGELTPEEYAQFSEQINTMAVDNANAYAAAFSEQLVSPEAQQLMYENLQAQKEAAEIEAILAEGAEATEMSTAALESYAESLMSANEMTDDQRVLAAKVAVQHAKLAKGLNKVQDIYNDNVDVLKEADEASLDYHEAIGKLSEALTETFGLEVSPSFVKNADNLELIKKAAEGDIEALQDLRQAINADFVVKLDLSTETAENALTEFLTKASNEAANKPIGSTITLDNTDAIAAINEALYTGKATIEDIEAMFNNANLAMPEYKTTTVPGEMVHTTSTAHYKGPRGIEWDVTSDTTTTTDRVIPYFGDQAPSLQNGKMDYGGGGKIDFSTQSNNTSLDNTLDYEDPDSSKSDKKKEKRQSDIVEKYKETSDALEEIADQLSDVNKQSDRLYGQNRINKLKEANKLLQDQRKELEKQKIEAQGILNISKDSLNEKAKELGVNLEFNGPNGAISNYTEKLKLLYEQLKDSGFSETLETRIQELNDAIKEYDEARAKIRDIDNQIEDNFNEEQDNNYEQLSYALEIEIDLNDMQMEKLDYYLDKIADDFYSMAEAAQYMTDKIPQWKDSLSDYETFYEKIGTAYDKGEISQAAYVEGLKETHSAILDNLSSLNELDKEMMHYYGDTLDAASEELSYYTDQLSNLTGVLEHYKNIVALVHGEYDFNRVEAILKGQATTIKNELDIATANYKMLETEKAAIEASYVAATDPAQRELLKEELKNITTALSEAQEEMLSMTEAWGEAMQAIMQNTMDAAAHDLEAAFTGGMGFDSLSSSLDRLVTFQDEYLTKTNQLYETQKMMRTAQQASDKTNNEAAKLKFKNYISEIQQLQEKDQLSQLDLEIAQARYNLLLAEIALTEAQNAKSTVRLQRDSEGNFGYVYTADQEAVSAAEQELADAENALYNIGLQATNDYGQKRIELQQQLADELIALNERRAAGEFETDELFYAERDRIISEYNNLFIAYSNQYTTALGVDVNIQKDAWVLAYQDMIDKTSDWKTATKDYLTDTEEAYKNYQQKVSEALNDIEDNVVDVIEESDKLAKEVTNDVIPALGKQIEAVRNATAAYATQRSEIKTLIEYYEKLADSIREAVLAQASMTGEEVDFGPVPSSSSGSGSKGNGSSNAKASVLASEAQRLIQEVHSGKVGNGGAWKAAARTANYSEEAIALAAKAFNESKAGAGPEYFYEKALEIAGAKYDTGGYTGAWGPEGRLATLHEKELVLNKVDTENFLAATEILRTISNVIDLQALHNHLALNSNNFGIPLGGAQQLEQSVMIEANFPNVQDRNEIQEAFNNLINTASQYANRKN